MLTIQRFIDFFFSPCLCYLLVLVLQAVLTQFPAVLAEALGLPVEVLFESSLISSGSQVCNRANRFFTLSCNVTDKAPHLSLALSFPSFSFLCLFPSALKWHTARHMLSILHRESIQSRKTLSPGFDDLLWHNFKLLLGFNTLSANCNSPYSPILYFSYVSKSQTAEPRPLKLDQGIEGGKGTA